ncbi:hypothetical protein BpHYR1_007341 [Brachionus plicatilis]|uniref:Uncharacterized protein n=1 Tax=Brachionus plicatilis TaxID=10195 RepID=A0A3M7SJY4_BRAPC|nr:hypothetical protein BpHYR1_007341 [Brachionus plicatilis]
MSGSCVCNSETRRFFLQRNELQFQWKIEKGAKLRISGFLWLRLKTYDKFFRGRLFRSGGFKLSGDNLDSVLFFLLLEALLS